MADSGGLNAVRKLFSILAFAVLMAAGFSSGPARAFSPPRVEAPEAPLTLVAGGCGIGFHRTPWGRCIPNGGYYGAPVYGGGGYYRPGPYYRGGAYYGRGPVYRGGGYYRRGPVYRGGAYRGGPYRGGPNGRVYR